MIVRAENESGVFAVLFTSEQEKEARSLYERMANDVCGKLAVIELLDAELNTLKIKFSYNNTYTDKQESSL